MGLGRRDAGEGVRQEFAAWAVLPERSLLKQGSKKVSTEGRNKQQEGERGEEEEGRGGGVEEVSSGSVCASLPRRECDYGTEGDEVGGPLGQWVRAGMADGVDGGRRADRGERRGGRDGTIAVPESSEVPTCRAVPVVTFWRQQGGRPGDPRAGSMLDCALADQRPGAFLIRVDGPRDANGRGVCSAMTKRRALAAAGSCARASERADEREREREQ